jgi:DNA-binding ferritin-like protein (Dps family)
MSERNNASENNGNTSEPTGKLTEFFNSYLNPKRMRESKREYRANMARVEKLPDDYRWMFKKIQHHLWQFTAGDGYDMMAVQYDLIELFESGAAEGTPVIEITGDDVAAFCDELLANVKTYTENWREKLNREVSEHFAHRNPDQGQADRGGEPA